MAERRRIAAAHREDAHGYLWFMMNGTEGPAAIRAELAPWGFAADEFADNGHWPYHFYVREARRLAGEFVMTQRDVMEERGKPDAVALGSFFLDVHAVQLAPCQGVPGGLAEEGALGIVPVRPYEIPYRALLPRRLEAGNLLAPVCLSASHAAFASIRMEPVYAMLGHAAGCAIALAAEQGCALHDLRVTALQDRLAAEGQVLEAGRFRDWWPFPPMKERRLGREQGQLPEKGFP